MPEIAAPIERLQAPPSAAAGVSRQDAVPERRRPVLSQHMSLLLDAARLGAALLVMVSHLALPAIEGDGFHFPGLAFSAVMLFFVMSGFVISQVVSSEATSFASFMIARLARLWSVLLPALLLTLLLDVIGMSVSPQRYLNSSDALGWDMPLLRLLAAGSFINQFWFWSIVPFSNAPVWSLSFEFAYYLLFAIHVFAGGRRRLILLVLALLLVGPKILLLMPPWICGVLAHRACTGCNDRPPAWVGWAMLLLPPLAFCGLYLAGAEWWLLTMQRQFLGAAAIELLDCAQEFLWAWLVGVLVAVGFAGFQFVGHRFGVLLARIGGPIRCGAAMTLSIYLTHLPIMLCVASLLEGWPPGLPRVVATFGLTLAGSVAFGLIFERQRFRLRRFMTDLLLTERPRSRASA